MGVFNGTLALANFQKRRLANQNVKKINNASLRAGSPMTYYCKHCGAVAAVLPEDHWEPAPNICGECNLLDIHGLL